MDGYENLYEKMNRERAEKRAKADAEWALREAQERADRAARDRDEARKRAARERANAQEEVEYAREAEADAEARADMWQERAGQLVAALQEIVNAWDNVLPADWPLSGVEVPSLGDVIETARKLLDERPADHPGAPENVEPE